MKNPLPNNPYPEGQLTVDFWIHVTLRERSTGDVHVLTGRSADDAFRDIDDREITAASARFARGMSDQNGGSLAFSRSDGVDLRIHKADPDWSSQIAAAVMAELEERRPRWSGLRTTAGTRLARMMLTIATGGVTALIALRHGLDLGVIVTAAALVVAYLTLSRVSFRRLLPGFEVTTSGRSRVDHLIEVVVVSVIVAFVVGVVVNLVT